MITGLSSCLNNSRSVTEKTSNKEKKEERERVKKRKRESGKDERQKLTI